MISRKGVIGQIISAPFALILIFIIMLLFVIYNGIAASRVSTLPQDISSGPQALALLHIFLNREVRGEEVNMREEKVSVSNLLLLSVTDDGRSQEQLINYLQNLFDNSYSCGGKNVLKVVLFSDSSKVVLIDYPVTFGTLRSYPLQPQQLSADSEKEILCVHHMNSVAGASSFISGERFGLCVYVEVNALC